MLKKTKIVLGPAVFLAGIHPRLLKRIEVA